MDGWMEEDEKNGRDARLMEEQSRKGMYSTTQTGKMGQNGAICMSQEVTQTKQVPWYCWSGTGYLECRVVHTRFCSLAEEKTAATDNRQALNNNNSFPTPCPLSHHDGDGALVSLEGIEYKFGRRGRKARKAIFLVV